MALNAGTKLGPYEITSPLGAGGMGEVYRARDMRLGRDVAIKVLPSSFAEHPDRLVRFEAEARAAGQLNHPNVLTVFDVGTHGGAPYLVTELLDGSTLRERLAEGVPAPRKSLEWATQIALGLGAAHDKGIVHRDLKPANVFVTRDGRVKILDFGLARVISGDGSDTSTATAIQATDPGTVLGTVGYMSPEQVRGKPADARSDLFGLGATLYEMLTGTRAFQRESPAETMAAILKEDPPDLADSGRNIPAAADRIVRRCLEKEPGERFQSARDLAFALEAIGGSTSTGREAAVVDPADRPRGRSRASLAVSGVLVAVAAYAAGRFGPGAPPASSSAPLPALRQLTFDGGDAREPALAPDGDSFVFVSNSSGPGEVWSHIFLQRVGGENPIDLTKDSASENFQPAFSPDGKLIAFRSTREGGGIFVMGATGESVRRITDGGANPAWSPDGASLAFATEGIFDPFGRSSVSSLWRVDVATGAKTKVFDGDAVQPSWSPDGKRIAFWGLPPGSGHRAIYTVPVSGGTPTVLVDDAAYNWSPKWSRDGANIYFASTRQRPMGIWRIGVDPASGGPRGSAVPVASGTETYLGLSELMNGAFVFPSSTSIDLVERLPVDARALRVLGEEQVLLRSARDVSYMQPSPDGRYIAMTIDDTNEDLVVVHSDGTGATRLTNDPARDRGATWTPDSDRLFFSSDRSGQYEAWTIKRDGSGLQQVTKRSTASGMSNTLVSPDSRTLSVDAEGGRLGFIDISDLTVSHDVRWVDLPKNSGFYGFAWSPDGHALLGHSGNEPAVFTVATGTVKPVPGIGTVAPLAMLDDRTVFCIDATGRLETVDATTGQSRVGDQLPAIRHRLSGPPAFSGDGRWLYFTERQTVAHVWLLTIERPPGRR